MLKPLASVFSLALFASISSAPNDAANTSIRLAQADPCNCNATLRTRVATCNTIFPPASRSREHTNCLQKARDEFDACRKAC